MYTRYLVGALLIFVTNQAYSEESISTQHRSNENSTQRNLAEEYRLDPLGWDKDRLPTVGVEINLLRLLLNQDDYYKSFSGTVSFFNKYLNSEIAFPFLALQMDQENHILEEFSVATIDAQYRQYTNKKLEGFYISAFLRLTALRGFVGEDDICFECEDTQLPLTKEMERKVGVGLGVGYRIPTKYGFYWGASLQIGRNIKGESDKFVEHANELYVSEWDDSATIFDIELLKVGLAF